jgi:hypothetical protein
MKSASCWFHYTDVLWCTVIRTSFHLFNFVQGDKGYPLTGLCYCSLLTESYYLIERRQSKRANQQGVTMKPETQQYHQARDVDKATSQQRTTTHNYTCYYLFIFRSLVYRANTARRFCHFCSPTLFDLLWFASRGPLRTWERSILGFNIPLQELTLHLEAATILCQWQHD